MYGDEKGLDPGWVPPFRTRGANHHRMPLAQPAAERLSIRGDLIDSMRLGLVFPGARNVHEQALIPTRLLRAVGRSECEPDAGDSHQQTRIASPWGRVWIGWGLQPAKVASLLFPETLELQKPSLSGAPKGRITRRLVEPIEEMHGSSSPMAEACCRHLDL